MHIDIKIHNDKIIFNILEKNENGENAIYRNEIILPICYSFPEKLEYIRNLVDIFIDEYDVKSYTTDIYIKHRNIEDKIINEEIKNTVKIQGVLEELFLSRGVIIWK